jgi:hypothetical protein
MAMEHEAFTSDDVIARRSPRRRHRVAARLGGTLGTLLVWSLVLIAVLSAAGRFRLVAVQERALDVNLATTAVAVVEPIPVLTLKQGDVFVAKPSKGGALSYYRVSAVDLYTRAVTVRDTGGKFVHMQIGGQAWRVKATIPVLGDAFHLATGPIQAVFFIMFGLLFIGRAEMLRHPRNKRAPIATTAA